MPATNYRYIWPQQGDYVLVAANSTIVVNFEEGTVARENNTTDRLSSYLRATLQEAVQSVLIEVDQRCVAQFDTGEKFSIQAGEIVRVPNIWLKTLALTTTVATNCRVWGSSHPEGVPQKFSSAIVGGKVTNTPQSSVGRPFSRMTRGSVLAATYSNIASYTVPGAGTNVNIREIALDANTIGSVRFKLNIAGENQFRGLVLTSPYAIPFPDNTLKAGSYIVVQAQSLGGTYKAVAGIAGVKY